MVTNYQTAVEILSMCRRSTRLRSSVVWRREGGIGRGSEERVGELMLELPLEKELLAEL